MRLNLRLHGRTADGRECQADLVYAVSANDLQKQADDAARTAAWMTCQAPFDHIPEGSQIVVENVEKL